MDWTISIAEASLQTLAWLLALAGVFAVLVRLMPCKRGASWWNDLGAAATDLLYWLVMPVVSRLGATLLLAAGVAVLFGGNSPGWTKLQDLPLWQQCLAILVLQDVMLYWAHRAFHTRWIWRFHAVHHSPTVLDWLSASRFHVVNRLLSFVLADVIVLLMGFSPAALVALVPFETIYSSMVHANLNWTFGPLRYVFASPVFHRWHHTTEEQGLDKNFASTFPVLDLVFGTFYMPAGELPERFGNGDPAYPRDFWGQLLLAFRARAEVPAAPVASGSPLNGRHIDALIAVALVIVIAIGAQRGHNLRCRDVHCADGAKHFDSEHFPQSIAEFTLALDHDPRCASAYANRASAHFNLGELEPALADFDRALELDPSLAIAWWRRGFVHARLGNLLAGRQDHERALQLDPSLAN